MNNETRVLVLLVSVIGLLSCVIVVLVTYKYIWRPFWQPVGYTTDLLTACQQNPASTGCSPRALYDELCGLDPPDERCEEFCVDLNPASSKFCEYMDSCAKYREDFAQRCSTVLCSPEDLTNCTPDQLYQFCVSGVASAPTCASYCKANVHCSWVDPIYAGVCTLENCIDA